MTSVWVYKYRYWDSDRQAQVVSGDMYTLEAIRAGLGTPVLDSGTRVRDDEVDANGRMKRVPVRETSRGRLSH